MLGIIPQKNKQEIENIYVNKNFKNMQKLKLLNSHLNFYSVEDKEFRPFGRILSGYDFSKWINYLNFHTQIPPENNVYVAEEAGLTDMPPYAQVRDTLFGAMPIQVGYCNGNSSFLNALEYHKSIEVVVAATDLVLMVADYNKLENFKMDTKNVCAFFVPAGFAIELKPTTLHLAPSKVNVAGFKAAIVLPFGTNSDLPKNINKQSDDVEGNLLFKKSKWFLAHPQNHRALANGAVAGLIGDNLEIKYL